MYFFGGFHVKFDFQPFFLEFIGQGRRYDKTRTKVKIAWNNAIGKAHSFRATGNRAHYGSIDAPFEAPIVILGTTEKDKSKQEEAYGFHRGFVLGMVHI